MDADQNNNDDSSKCDYQDYYINKDQIIYKIIIEKLNNEISIKCQNYINNFNKNNFSILTNIKFDSITLIYKYIIKNFKENNVIIKILFQIRKSIYLF